MEKIYTISDWLFASPARVLCSALAIVFAGFLAQVIVPYLASNNSGKGNLLEPPAALVLAGQEVYYTEGCQYCHSQNIRPLEQDHRFFNKIEEYGYFPQPDQAEYDYDSPSQLGSFRIGPDLSRVAARITEPGLQALLSGKASVPGGKLHDYQYLFEEDPASPVLLAWKIKAMTHSGSYLSEPYLRSAYLELDERSKGDALIAYLLERGKKQREFAGKYYRE